jgi:DNA modification methylase
MREGRNENRATLGGGIMATNAEQLRLAARTGCGKCGARRIDRQLGLEKTPEEYVARMVEVFREVRRVLTDDGTLWLNLGDSYTSGGRKERDPGQSKIHPAYEGDSFADGLRPGTPNNLKPKDLVGIPWRVAFALQADGWYLRSDIIWSKPNPMPESVTDRPTKSHEYIFLLSKSATYFYDAAAIAEEASEPAPRKTWEDRKTAGEPMRQGINAFSRAGMVSGGVGGNGSTRNARSVWAIATQPYPQAHFATFPEELARRCILAGSAKGDAVLDPFGGSGTVAAVAVGNGRSSVYIDLNPEYIELARHRIGPMLCVDADAKLPEVV